MPKPDSMVQKLKLTAVFGLVFIMLVIPVAPAFADQQPATDIPPVVSPVDQTTADIAPAVSPADSIDNSKPQPVVGDDNVPSDKKSEKKKKEDLKADPSSQTSLNSLQSSMDPQDKRFDTSKKTSLKVDESSGSLSYSVPIIVPPGRNKLQPDLVLQYSSQSSEEDSEFGYGWDINIPYIERINRTGGENLYNTNTFNSSLSGELVSAGGSTFVSKVDNGEFLSYTFFNNQWIVKDKQGWTYKFGLTSGSRQDDPSDSTKAYKWMLEELLDTNGNKIAYQYIKSTGQIYPYKINYNVNGADNGIFEIEFLREARTDVMISYKPTFATTTDQRINEIQVKVNGNWIRKYSLQYSNGDNGKRSMLDAVTESGKDDAGTTTTLPATQFDYQVSTVTGNPWQTDDTHPFPVDIRAAQFGDVNGDGLQDIVYSFKPDSQPVDSRTYLNNGDGSWTLSPQYASPVMMYQFVPTVSNPWDMGVRLVDVNGDGLVDVLYRNSANSGTWLNNGNGWTQQTGSIWSSPLPFVTGPYGGDQSTFADIADINCDGLPDIFTARQASNSQNIDYLVYINNGVDGWTNESNIWSVPVDLRWGTEFTDVNNDGCADIVQSYNTSSGQVKGVYYSNGKNGWVQDPNFIIPTLFFNRDSSPNDRGARQTDLNGDGLVDFVISNDCTSTESYLDQANNYSNNTISSWNPGLIAVQCNSPVDLGVRYLDIDSDGMQDVIQTTTSGGPLISIIKKNIRKKADLLSKVTLSTGGTTDITYKATPLYKNSNTFLNPNLPSVLMVVDSLITSDGVSPNITQNYIYEGGKYYYNNPQDKKFAGFSKITVTDAVGNKTVTFYHQGDSSDTSHGEFDDHSSKIGKPYRVEQRDSANNLYAVTTNKWDRFDFGNGASFVKLANTLNMVYDGDATHRDSAESYVYDNANGNVTQKVEYGEVTGSDNGTFVDLGLDDFTTNSIYAVNAYAHILGLPDYIKVSDHGDNRVSESRYYYDNLTLGQVTKGNQTKVETWKSGSQTGFYPAPSHGYVPPTVNVLVLAGGAGGGGLNANGAPSSSGGGGAGGLLYENAHVISAGPYSITVGNGGIGGDTGAGNGTNGANSIFDNLIAIGGGGGGGALAGSGTGYDGFPGGSGGGASPDTSITRFGGSGTTNQGTNGGSITGSNQKAAGGGGAGAPGDFPTPSRNGFGGKGIANSISGLNVTYATGGNGGVAGNGQSGSANTGNGGGGFGGSGGGNGGNGGSGIVIISYPTGSITATGGTITTSGSNTIHTFTGNGTFTVNTIADPVQNAPIPTGNYVSTQKSYNSTYGTLASDTDQRGKVTTYSNDAYNLYPASVTDPLTHVTSYAYDYSSGKVKQKTDQNNRVFQTIYDGLDRVIEEKQPDISNPASLVTKSTYSYIDIPTSPVFDAQTSGTEGTSSTTYTLAHTTSGINRFLVVGVTGENDSVTSVTYNGAPLTKLNSAYYGHGFSVWYLVNPASGTHDIVVNNNVGYMAVVANSFTGVNQTSPIGTYASTITGFGTSESLDVPSNVGDLVLSLLSVRSVGSGAATITENAGQTEESNVVGDFMGITNLNRTVSSIKHPTPGFKTTMGYGFSQENYKLHFAFALKPVDTANTIKKSDYLDGSVAADTYIYNDALGRKIQERVEAEGTNYSVKDTVYNNLGLVLKESLPYFSTGSSKTSATTDTNLYSNYTYDPVQRISTIANAVGTTTNTYSDWKLTITDPNGKNKDQYKDAYGNLVQVDEHNGASTYSTYYLYNYLGNLTKITDALGNTRNFTYDGLGRRLTAEDLHASADATYGTWTYTYDDDGNLTQTIDPKNQTVNYTFDDINRPLTEDYTGQAGTEVTYTYDSGTDGIGQLTNIVNSAVNKAMTYNALGGLKQETDTLNGVNYVTSYDYDRQGNQINITNPDNSQVKYIYNSAGLLDQVQRKESTDGSFSNVVSNFDYGPHGKITTQSNANGTTTTNTYDATKMYRLSRKQTSGPGGGGGLTTTTFYTIAGDGHAYFNTSNSWSTTHDSTTGSGVSYTGTTFNVRSGKVNNTKYEIDRGFLPFDTSSIPDTAQISSAKLKVYVDSKLDNDNDGDDWVTVTQGSQANTTSLVTADYDNAGSITNPIEGINSSERKDITNVSTGAYLEFNLNATGKAWISLTGSTKLALREGHDATNSTITGSSGQYDGLTIRGSEYIGTTSDPILEVTYYTAPPAPTVIQDASYTYDNNGNILTITDASGTDTAKTTTYTYDDLNRLLSAAVTSAANGDNTTKNYTYDAIGNISSSTDKGTYLYQGTNKSNPHAATSIGGVTYTYDDNGNLTADSTFTNTWDYQNRMTQSAKTGLTETYAYDPSGQRVKLSNGAVTTYYPTKQYNTDGTTAQKHIFAGGALIATIKGTGASASATYDHTDQLNGTGPITNGSGAMVQLLDYHPYGTMRVDWQYTPSQDEQRKFTGHEFDRDTGLNYMGARYYSSAIGRFTSQDNVFLAIGNNYQVKQFTGSELQQLLSDPQQLNSYAYARNNPINYRDPDGNFIQILAAAVFGFFANPRQAGGDLDSNGNTVPVPSQSRTAHYGGIFAGMALNEVGGKVTGKALGAATEGLSGFASKIEWNGNWTKGSFGVAIKNLGKHFSDHGAELGYSSTKEYLQGAKSFLAEALKNGYQSTIDGKGSVRVWDAATKRFATYEFKGGAFTPATFFKADYSNYWTNQMSTYIGQRAVDLGKLIK